MLRVIIHDANNHLATIGGYAQVICMQAHLAAADAGTLAAISDRAGDITAAVGRFNDMLQRYALVCRQRPALPARVLLGEVVRKALDRLDARLQPTRVQVADISSVYVESDAEAASIALAEVLNNALLATARGGEVRLSAQVTSDSAVLSVEDEGVGLNEEQLGRAFDDLYSGWTEAERAGLGLGIAQRCVAGCGGSITLASSGRGAECRLVLPLSLPVNQNGGDC